MGKDWRIGVCAALLSTTLGCGKDDVEEARKHMAQQNPGATSTPAPEPQTPAMGMPAVGSTGPNDGNPIPLKMAGSASAAELQRDVAKLGDAAAAAQFERAFRLTFSSDPTRRDYRTADALLSALETSHPKFAPSYRTRGYALFNLNPAAPAGALAEYDKAVAIDPNYGEAHYAIAFMCAATGELDKGVEHYKKAMTLGVPDERNIGQRFYADRLAPR